MGGERGRNFDESPPSGRRHLCGAVDHAAAAQVPVERHLDDRLALPAELLGEQGPRPLIGVPVCVGLAARTPPARKVAVNRHIAPAPAATGKVVTSSLPLMITR